jgi:transcriptional regulator GlxA family with amidase domain
MHAPRDIAVVAFDQVNSFDLSSPMEVFMNANFYSDPAQPPYRLHMVAPSLDPVRSEPGMLLQPELAFADAPPFDTIIVPGGAGLRDPAVNALVVAWLKERLPSTRRVASICTGIYGLAPTGALDGQCATTHWRFTDDVRRRFPAIRVEPDSNYVRSGSIYSSGGISAGVDLSLALVAEDLGPRMALTIAREMLVHVVRPGGQAQFSEPIRAQGRAPDRLSDLVAWIGANLDRDLSVEALAARAGVCERQLTRQFRDGMGESPGAFVQRLRLDAARDALTGGALPVELIAGMTGYASGDAFRRAFARAYGVAPSEYRRAFRPRDVRNRRVGVVADA